MKPNLLDRDKRFRRLRNAACDILLELDELQKEEAANVPAPEVPQQKKRSNKYRDHFDNLPAGTWRKPAELKKIKK